MANQENTGIKRLFNAVKFSKQGLQAAFTNEEAFRLETLLFLISVPVAFFICVNVWQMAIIIFAGLFMLIVELLNSAIEAVVDRVGLEKHELSGRAKDIGSAAVSLALIGYFVLWAAIIYTNYLT
ncbi:diacylglycerol kinase [Marinicellulosiphila megalodicopiae]|uniref:diacylglycerol kinase n=1 Tax=Marinicellulosiphila megalodicopiae TaxID=2724896 RepID=UPI003BB0A956